MSNASGQGDLRHPVFILDRANIFSAIDPIKEKADAADAAFSGEAENGAGESLGKAENFSRNRE